jgi:protein-S-isoprenylcysteine O-methyltransferase Ste14
LRNCSPACDFLLLAPAWTLDFWQAGVYLFVFAASAALITAATIEVAPGQKVISTGPYAIVRHPMYSGALVMLFGTPLALGSLWGLLLFIPMTFVIVWRLLDEEKFLSKNLSGYVEYCKKVQYRLVPFIW